MCDATELTTFEALVKLVQRYDLVCETRVTPRHTARWFRVGDEEFKVTFRDDQAVSIQRVGTEEIVRREDEVSWNESSRQLIIDFLAKNATFGDLRRHVM